MTSPWYIYIPAAGTNLILNPTAEASISTYVASGGGATLTRDTTTAKFGGACLKVVTAGGTANEGAFTAQTVCTPSLAYVGSVWLKGNVGGEQVILTLRESTSVPVFVADTTAATITLTTVWTRYEVSRVFGSTGANARLLVRTFGTAAITFFADAFQIEVGTVATTYIDGNQTGCSWTGTQYASTSVRDAQSRAGGVITNFDALGSGMTDSGSGSGAGMPPHDHISTPYGLLDGSLFQRTGIKSRSFVVPVWINGSTIADYHTKRKALINAVKRDLVTPVQPCRIRYQPSGSEPLEIDAHYDGGLEGGARDAFTETVNVRFVADDPYWRSPGNGAVGLVYKNDLTNAAYIVERQATGAWQVPGRGVQTTGVRVVAYGPDGFLYAGGSFPLAIDSAGATVAGTAYIARWNHTLATPTWEALNGGMNNDVYALAWDAAGTLYAGGAFTTANGATATSTKYLAKWNGSTWSAVGSDVGTGSVLCLANGASGLLYVGGTFVNWPNADANADGDSLVSWNGTAFHRLAGGTNGTIQDMAVAVDGTLYIGGSFTHTQEIGGAASIAATQYLAKWTGSAWAGIGTTVLNNTVSGVVLDNGGNLYIAGAWTNTGFPYVARWTGASWVPLGSGVNDIVYYLSKDLDGSLIASGQFTTAGGYSFNDRVARWTGSAWIPLDIDLPGSPIAYKVAVHPDGRMAVPFNTSGTATASNTVTTVTNRGTASSSPVFRVLGPGVLESIVNWTTKIGLYFNYTLVAGEYLTIDTRPGRLSCVSTLRGDVLGSALLPSSNLSGFRLLSGLNTIVTKMPSGTSGATEVTAMFRENFLSFDT